MSQPFIETEFITPGALLRATRVKKNIDLAGIADDTKISLRNLKAMEADDFSALPADAYSRGFYRLYAVALSLPPDEILKKYSEEKAKWPSPVNPLTEGPKALTNHVSDMATRPTSMSLTYIGLILFLLFLLGAFISWYFSWNPATYISERLRGVEKTGQVEHVQDGPRQPLFVEPSLQSTYSSPLPGDTATRLIIPDSHYSLR